MSEKIGVTMAELMELERQQVDAQGGYASQCTLRDYFAGQALAGLAQLLTDNEVSALADGIKGGAIQARAAYTLADAMLKERSK